MNEFLYKVNDTEYPVVVIHKRIRNIHFRFKEGKFVVTCNQFTLKRQIIRGLDKFAENLIKRSSKESPIGEDYIYLFGEKYNINPSGSIVINNKEIKYKDIEQLKKKLKPVFEEILTKRVRYYEKLMKLPSYTVKVRNMTSRYGSNSKRTKNINFAFLLIHYSIEIIDSVVVHELAHIEVFNHSKKFYDVVYKYYHKYDECHKKLRKGEFK